jgi:hypothetical protein
MHEEDLQLGLGLSLLPPLIRGPHLGIVIIQPFPFLFGHLSGFLRRCFLWCGLRGYRRLVLERARIIRDFSDLSEAVDLVRGAFDNHTVEVVEVCLPGLLGLLRFGGALGGGAGVLLTSHVDVGVEVLHEVCERW